MSALKLPAFAVVTLALAAVPPAASPAAPLPPGPRTDRYGDALPPGAVGRLGTVRLRHGCAVLTFAPDGKTFATGGADQVIRVWDVANGRELRQCKGHTAPVTSVLYPAGGKTLVTGSFDGTVRVWDAATGRESRKFGSAEQPIQALALTADGATLVVLCHDGTVRVYDFAAGKETARIEDHRGKTTLVALSPDGRRFATYGQEDQVAVWDAGSAKELCRFGTGQKNLGVSGIGVVAFAADGKSLATVGAEPVIVRWDAETGKELGRFEGVTGIVRSLAFSADGRRLAAKGADRPLHVWGVASGKDLRQFALPAGNAGIVAFSPDGKVVAAVQGQAIHLWDVAANKELHDFGDCATEVTDVRFAPDGRTLLTCDQEGTARRWETATGKQTAAWTRPEAHGFRMFALPDGKGVVTPSAQGLTLAELGGDGTAERPVVPGVRARMLCEAVSPDGKTLAVRGRDRVVTFWGVETGKVLGHLEGSQEGYVGFAFSPDGKLLAGCGHNQPVRIWDVASGKEVLQFEVRNEVEAQKGTKFWTKGANRVAFSPDGRGLLTVDIEVSLWEVATGGNRFHTSRPPSGMSSAAFSPDGCALAAGTVNGMVFVLDTVTGKELGRLEGHRGAVHALAFAADGKTLASGSADATVLLWDTAELAEKGRPAPAELKPERLAALWRDLADGDAAKAHQAGCALAAAPKQAAGLLKSRLLGAADNPEAQRIARLIRELDDDSFAVREKAHQELADLEDLAVPALRKALEGEPTPEVRRRAADLLEKRKGADKALAALRVRRLLEALERSGAKEAIRLLEELVQAAPDARTRQDAKACLERLAKRAAL